MKLRILGLLVSMLAVLSLFGCESAAPTYTVIFDYDCMGHIIEQSVRAGDAVTMPPERSRVGYQSAGWWVQEGDVWRQWDFEADTVHADMALLHHWRAEQYTLILKHNDGTDKQHEITVTYNEEYHLPTLQREGYVFEGWYLGGVRMPMEGMFKNNQNAEYIAAWSLYGMGTTVNIGKYEQDNHAENGLEPIEWMILDVSEDGKAYFLMSRFLIDAVMFHENQSKVVPYQDRTLHVWLNGNFLNTVFTPQERNAIQSTQLDEVKTEAFVFLPNKVEIDRYLVEAKYRVGTPTVAVAATGINPEHEGSYAGYAAEPYWLRAYGSSSMQYYETTGVGVQWGSANGKRSGLRPAMWVDAAYVDALLSQQ